MKLFFLKLNDKYWLNWLFLWIVLLIYIFLGIFSFSSFINIWKDFLSTFVNQILLVLVIVFIFMFVLNLILEKDIIKNKIKNSKSSTKYIFSIIWWIFSTGPVYLWYPFLKQLHDNWLNYWHLASFIYARAVKIPFLIIMIFYFWLKYTIIFNITLVLLALIVWILTNLIFKYFIYENNNS